MKESKFYTIPYFLISDQKVALMVESLGYFYGVEIKVGNYVLKKYLKGKKIIAD